MSSITTALDLADSYFDQAPRIDAEVVAVGPFTLFVSKTPFSYYARPARDTTSTIAETDIAVLAKECDGQGVDLAVEWVGELRPELRPAAEASGLDVSEHALLIAAPGGVSAPTPEGARLRVLGDTADEIALARAVANVSFQHGGVAVGAVDGQDRDAAAKQVATELIEHLRARARSGATITIVAEDGDERGIVAVGSCQPVGEVAEILAMATLPSARRRGLAAAVVSRLAAVAVEQGVRTLVLSAQDEAVARVYARTGFQRIGHALAAGRPD